MLDRLWRFVRPKIEHEIDDQASAGGDRAAGRAGNRVPGTQMRHHAREPCVGKRKLRCAGLGRDRVEDVRPFREIGHHHFVDELGRAVLNDRRRFGEEGDLQLGRARVARGGGMSEKRGGEGQHHQARKGHMFFSELCFAGELRPRIHTRCFVRPRAPVLSSMPLALNHDQLFYRGSANRSDGMPCRIAAPRMSSAD